MKQKLLLLLSLTLVAACAQDDDALLEEVRDTLPAASEVRLDVPSTDNKSTLGAVAEFYQHTRNTSDFLNAASVVWVGLIQTIMRYPATSVEGDTITWGPWNDDSALRPFAYKLVAVRTGDRSITYALSGKRRADAGDFIPLIEGAAERPDAGERGRGSLTLLFDNQAVIDVAKRERGSIAIRYDLTGEPRTNAVTFSDFVNERGEGPRDSEYGYLQRADGSGRFDFLTLADVDNDAASQLENLHIVSNWDATGAGRSDVAAWGGNLGEVIWNVAQCWDASFLATFTSYAATGGAQPVLADEGDAASCAVSGETVAPLL